MSYCQSSKDLEIGWLEKIPSNWNAIRLRHLTSKIGSGKTPLGGSAVYVSEGVPLIRSQNVLFSGLSLEEVVYISPEIDAEMSSSRVAPSDVLLNITGASLGRCCIFPEHVVHANVNQHVCIIRPIQEYLLSNYLAAFLTSHLGQAQIFMGEEGISREGLTFEDISNFWIPLPPLPEQRSIAQYLDCQTAKIDTLITAKQRLLELLAEKRRALITHAVTHGLNPDVPMRDSDAGWYGKIPQHWEVKRLRWFIKTLEQGWSPQAEEREPAGDEWGVLKLNAVKDGQFDPSKAKALPTSVEIPLSLEIHPGDFLITRANTPELVGDVCYVQETRPYLMLSDLIYRLRLDESKLDGQFLSFFLQTPIARLQIEVDARGSSASMVKISQGHILDWVMLIPPLSEQQEIVSYIEAKISKLDALRKTTEQTIALLHERRTALISAAVTGQIRIPA